MCSFKISFAISSFLVRFDEEGRGLGIEDKFELIDQQFGYVHGYKGKDQYDQKMAASRSRPGSAVSMTGRPLSSSSLVRPLSSSSKTRPSYNASSRSHSPK